MYGVIRKSCPTNLYVGFDPYFGVTILILAFFSLCILISRVGAICRKIILFSSSLRAETWFWSIHSSRLVTTKSKQCATCFFCFFLPALNTWRNECQQVNDQTIIYSSWTRCTQLRKVTYLAGISFSVFLNSSIGCCEFRLCFD